uniref:Uncharacterized protein n=1 Tax=Vespula pensylvanica TaxID=30213 RepID=A0A834P9R9_VESPE|nr:hypothetical protein H0235_002159 [Vespula pensylvanica]
MVVIVDEATEKECEFEDGKWALCGTQMARDATFATTTAVLLSIEPCRTYHEFRGLNLLWVERTLLNSGTSNPGVKGLFPDPDGYFISRECYG